MLKPEMDLRIRYARTCDGVNIAYWATGAGEPLVFLPTQVSNVQTEWQTDRRKVYSRLAENHLLVRYDGRGHGLSDRNPKEISLDAMVEDLRSVVDDLGLSRFAIFGPSVGAAAAIAFAARYPERVSRLILWMPFPSYEDYFRSAAGDALPLAHTNWELFTMTISHIRVGWAHSSRALDGARLMRESVSQDIYLREVEEAPCLNAYHLMSNIRVPTLVLCRRDYGEYETRIARCAASSIPTATFALVDGNTNGVWDDHEEGLAEIEKFLGVHISNVGTTLPEYLHNRSHDLSPREVDVLRYLADGWRNKEIAADLGLSVYTVARHIATIYAKIGAHGRAEATRYAIEHGILSTRELSAVR